MKWNLLMQWNFYKQCIFISYILKVCIYQEIASYSLTKMLNSFLILFYFFMLYWREVFLHYLLFFLHENVFRYMIHWEEVLCRLWPKRAFKARIYETFAYGIYDNRVGVKILISTLALYLHGINTCLCLRRVCMLTHIFLRLSYLWVRLQTRRPRYLLNFLDLLD